MSGFLRRIRRPRPAAPDPAPRQGAWSPGGETVHAHDEAPGSGGQPPLPAGVDLDAFVGDRPTTRRRGRLRRRLRHLRRVREVLLRDLGGLVFEIHRSGGAADPPRSDVVRGKLARIGAVTAELHELEDVLADRRGMVLREPGLGGTCPTCGELFGSEARFCWACGTPVAPGAARQLTAQATALPALGAAAGADAPSHEWHAAHPPPPRSAPPAAAPPPEPHIDGSGEELHPGTQGDDARHDDAPAGVGRHADPGGGVPADEAPTVVQPDAGAPIAARDNGGPAHSGENPLEAAPDTVVQRRPDTSTPELRPGDPLAERRS